MKLSRTLSYAVQALVRLTKSNSGNMPISCRKLAEAGNMPKRFLLQVLRSLVSHGILRSELGSDGGYVLVRPPEQISFLDIIEAIDGPVKIELQGLEVSGFDWKGALQGVSDGVRRELAALKLSHLAKL